MKIRDLVYEGQFTRAYLTSNAEWEQYYVLDHFSKIEMPTIIEFYGRLYRKGNGAGTVHGAGSGCGSGNGYGLGSGQGNGWSGRGVLGRHVRGLPLLNSITINQYIK